jgi:hypothetical protein
MAMSAGQVGTAQGILKAVLQADPGATEALFLMGQAESALGRWDAAAEYYRKILTDRPDLVRVRLELARALYQAKEDTGAEYHFRLALAEPDLPEAVIDNVYRFLTAIKRRRNYAFFLDVGIAPDSNFNGAPSKPEVTIPALGGQTFLLSDDARQKSGVGITGTANGEYLAPMSTTRDDRWRIGGSLYRSDYPGGEFDDTQLRVQTGPQFRFDRGDLSVLALFGKRWFGNDPYSESYGGRLEYGYGLTPSLRLDGYLEGVAIDHHSQTFLDGYDVNGVAFTTYGIDSQSYARLITGAGREKTESPAFSNSSLRLGFAYLRNFGWGITALVQPELQLAFYDTENPIFGRTREDRILRLQFSVLKRDFHIFGFSPTFTYIYTRDDSNIGFYSFTRNQFQIGFTREF